MKARPHHKLTSKVCPECKKVFSGSGIKKYCSYQCRYNYYYYNKVIKV